MVEFVELRYSCPVSSRPQSANFILCPLAGRCHGQRRQVVARFEFLRVLWAFLRALRGRGRLFSPRTTAFNRKVRKGKAAKYAKKFMIKPLPNANVLSGMCRPDAGATRPTRCGWIL